MCDFVERDRNSCPFISIKGIFNILFLQNTFLQYLEAVFIHDDLTRVAFLSRWVAISNSNISEPERAAG